MATIEEQIRELEEQISKTKYNKATEGHIGKLKAKIARLTEEEEKRRSSKGSTKGFYVKKAGNATVALVCIFESLGYKVIKLDRVFFAGLTKKGLRRGDWRYLSEAEVNYLRMGSFE